MTTDTWLGPVLRRERAITLVGPAALTSLAWLYLARLSGQMADMAAMAMAHIVTAVVLVEKLIPTRRLVSWVAGLLLVVWGLVTVWVHL